MLSIISYFITLLVFFGISLIIYLQLLNIELI